MLKNIMWKCNLYIFNIDWVRSCQISKLMVEILDFETLAWISQSGSQMCRGFICGLVDHMTDLFFSEMKNLVWGESEDLLLIDELCVCVCVCVCVCSGGYPARCCLRSWHRWHSSSFIDFLTWGLATAVIEWVAQFLELQPTILHAFSLNHETHI